MAEDNKELLNVEDEKLQDILEREGLVTRSALVNEVKQKFDEAERARQIRETQWLRNVSAYRGRDTRDARMRESEISDVFVRTTTVKVKAAYAQITESLFSENRYPIQVMPTPVPEGVSEYAHLKTEMDSEPEKQPDALGQQPQGPLGGIGFEGDGFEIAPGATQSNFSYLGGLEEEFTNEAGDVILAEGASKDGSPTISPAKRLASMMDKIIQDQMQESNAVTETRRMIFEMCLLGTGIMKGPFNVNKTLHKWEDGQYMPEVVKTCKTSMVSAWNFYPDPNALLPEEMEWAIERHRLSKSQVATLKNRPHFRQDAIDRLLRKPGNWMRQDWETFLDEKQFTESERSLYEIYEYWGFMHVDNLKEFGLEVPPVSDNMVQVNAWVSGEEVLRVVVNPFIPQKIPYYVVPYEVDPYTIWGTGVPESMEDSQALMNGFARLAVDNLALAGNLIFDVDDSLLVPGQSMELYPGKIFRRQGGGVGQAIHGISFPNTAPQNMQLFGQFRQIADESTGIPSFAHGQTGITSPTRTSSGMSMLLQNASLNIKTVVRNIDDFCLKPLGEAMYRWNMQFNDRMDIKGDLEVKATGTSSMIAKEVRSTRLNNFLQMAGNPALAPLIKIPTILREFAISMDMDPDEILNSPEEAQIYAQLMGAQNMQHPAQQAAPGGLGPDGVPVPNEPGFTGNNAGAGNPEGVNGQALPL